MGLDLVTLAEYKAYASITSPNQDTAIKAVIPKVSELVKTICRRTFVDYVDDYKIETLNGGIGSNLYLKEYPLIAVSSVEYSTDYGQTYTELVEYTDYAINVEDGCIVAISSETAVFPKRINGYKVTYNGGYEELPEDLKLAVLDLITYYLQNDGSVHSPKAPGTNSVQIEYITKARLPAHIQRVLDFYVGSWD